MKSVKMVRAPVRVDFAGGTTDIFPFTHTHGGAVLNCGINRYVVGKIIKSNDGVHLEYAGNTPTSSGLGTSGVMNLVWLALISEDKKIFSKKIKYELAERVYALEQSQGLVGGKQDQYAAAFGGINFIEFKKEKVVVEQLKLDGDFVKKFENSLVLVYTGKPHYSGNSNKSMIDNLKKGKNTHNLIRIKNIAKAMRKALLRKDLDMFAELMNDETRERKQLHKSIVPRHIQIMIDEGFKNGAKGAKVCGSGGGGSILFLGDKKKLKERFGERVMDFKFDFQGLRYI